MTRKEIELHNSIMEDYKAAKASNRNYDAAIDLLKLFNLGAIIAFVIFSF